VPSLLDAFLSSLPGPPLAGSMGPPAALPGAHMAAAPTAPLAGAAPAGAPAPPAGGGAEGGAAPRLSLRERARLLGLGANK
jgi:hypothetical protein